MHYFLCASDIFLEEFNWIDFSCLEIRHLTAWNKNNETQNR